MDTSDTQICSLPNGSDNDHRCQEDQGSVALRALGERRSVNMAENFGSFATKIPGLWNFVLLKRGAERR
jgi:hypothetical protein